MFLVVVVFVVCFFLYLDSHLVFWCWGDGACVCFLTHQMNESCSCEPCAYEDGTQVHQLDGITVRDESYITPLKVKRIALPYRQVNHLLSTTHTTSLAMDTTTTIVTSHVAESKYTGHHTGHFTNTIAILSLHWSSDFTSQTNTEAEHSDTDIHSAVPV